VYVQNPRQPQDPKARGHAEPRVCPQSREWERLSASSAISEQDQHRSPLAVVEENIPRSLATNAYKSGNNENNKGLHSNRVEVLTERYEANVQGLVRSENDPRDGDVASDEMQSETEGFGPKCEVRV